MKKKWDIHITPKFILLILTILCILSIGVNYFRDGYGVPFRTAVGYLVVPLQTGINKVGSFFAGMADERMSLEEALEEIEQLQQENQALQQQVSQYSANMAELTRLQGLLGIRDYYDSYEMVGATVISSEAVNWNYRFNIDKGTKDGIDIGMTVICQDGLVGIVTEVAATYATVQTILDNASSVSGMDATTLDTCMVSGNQSTISSGYIDLSMVSADSSIKDGTPIVTSNISSRYVEGILIGTVRDIETDPNQLSCSGHLEPAVDFRRLREVLVITQTKESMTPPQED